MAGRILRVTRRAKAKVKHQPKSNFRLPKVGPSTLAAAILLVSLGVAAYILGLNWPFQKSPQNIPPVIYSIKPEYGPVGTEIVVKGYGFDEEDNTAVIYPQNDMPGYVGGLRALGRDTVKFTFPEDLNLCPPDAKNQGIPCPEALMPAQPGLYQIKVWTSQGTSNAVNFSLIDGE